MASFFRNHAKNTKLTKEEFEIIDNMLFSLGSPTKKSLPLFPRATPLGFGTTHSLNSKYHSFSSTIPRASRRRLEIFDQDTFISKPAFVPNEEPTNSSTMSSKTLATVNKSSNWNNNEIFQDSDFLAGNKVENLEKQEFNDSIKPHSPPRQMTSAAKELMASISMNVDSVPDKVEYSIKDHGQRISLPIFEFKIPENELLPEFPFDISDENNDTIISEVSKKLDYEFLFDISDYENGVSPKLISEKELPVFNFKID